MRPIVVSEHVCRPVAGVWAELERIEDHVEWMVDATGIEFLGDARRGVGTRLQVDTKLGPLRTRDLFEFTAWDAPHLMSVEHRGFFTGSGTFRLSPEGDGTRIDWSEMIRFPWFFGGFVGATLARPILRRIWRGNLRRLKHRVESP